MITLDVKVFEHKERRTASWFTSRIRRILTTLQNANHSFDLIKFIRGTNVQPYRIMKKNNFCMLYTSNDKSIMQSLRDITPQSMSMGVLQMGQLRDARVWSEKA